jgi:hypothetical protein
MFKTVLSAEALPSAKTMTTAIRERKPTLSQCPRALATPAKLPAHYCKLKNQGGKMEPYLIAAAVVVSLLGLIIAVALPPREEARRSGWEEYH